MSEIDAIKEQIAKTETVLAEFRGNFEANPEEYKYSVQVLLTSTENHLADLLNLYPLLHDSVVIQVVMPNTSPEVNNKHNLELSSISKCLFCVRHIFISQRTKHFFMLLGFWANF